MTNNARIARIAVLSRRLRWTVRGLIGLVVVLTTVALVLAALGSAQTTAVVSFDQHVVDWDRVPTAGRIGFAAILAPPIALVLAVLWLSDRLLGLYERGIVFSRENGRIIRRIGQLIVALSIFTTFAGPAMAGLMGSLGVLEDPLISIEPDLGLFLVGIWIIVAGHVMGLGAEMAEESALTI